MTRLKTSDIDQLSAELQSYDDRMQRSLGVSLAELGCCGAGVDTGCAGKTGGIRVAAVSVTSGEGVISEFCQTLVAIASFLGFSAEVMDGCDVAGISEAYQRQFDILLMADDNVFSAINIRNGMIADNSEYTGRGFAHGLDRLAGGVSEQPVLVLGCGPVGQSAISALLELGAKITVYDPDIKRCEGVVAAWPENGIKVAASPREGLASHSLVFEATPVAGVVEVSSITGKTCIAAPGVPCGVTEEAAGLLGDRLLWDPLQTGVATMLMAASFSRAG